MRRAVVFALRRGLARTLLGMGIVGALWTGLYKTWPWVHRGVMLERRNVHLFPTASSWDVPVALAGVLLMLACAVVIYRRRPVSSLEHDRPRY
jgi:hypothetical protein